VAINRPGGPVKKRAGAAPARRRAFSTGMWPGPSIRIRAARGRNGIFTTSRPRADLAFIRASDPFG
jgi:hypothetical protein